MQELLPLRYVYDVKSSCFSSLVPYLKFTLHNPQKQVTDVSLALTDSNMESENLSSLIPLSVSDGHFKRCISYRYIIDTST